MAGPLGIGTMLDTVEFMRKAWGGLGQMPGSLQPTVNPEEIEKRIADLKAVEQWLQLNLNMLRGTVQGLEVQVATIKAMKTMGQAVLPEAVSNAVGEAITKGLDTAKTIKSVAKPRQRPSAKSAAADSNPLWWNLLQRSFNDVAQAALKGNLVAGASKAPKTSKAPGAKKASSKKKVVSSPKSRARQQ
jgi:hypothetical protein